jgi:type II secretory pathway component PulK
MRRGKHNSATSERGAILLVVLWVVIALGVLAFEFASNVKLGARSVRNSKEGTAGYFLAKAAVNESIFEMLKFGQPGVDPDAVALFNQLRISRVPLTFTLDTGQAQCWVENEMGKLDLNMGSPILFQNLLVQQYGLTDREAMDLIARWNEWRKPTSDSDPELHGGPLNSIEDLAALKGMKAEIIYGSWGLTSENMVKQRRGLIELATVFTGSQQINLNYAPVEILRALPGVDASEAEALVRTRNQHFFKSVSDCQDRVPLQFNDIARGMVTVEESPVLTLVATGRATGSSVDRTVRVIMQFNSQDPLGYRILYWKDEEI